MRDQTVGGTGSLPGRWTAEVGRRPRILAEKGRYGVGFILLKSSPLTWGFITYSRYATHQYALWYRPGMRVRTCDSGMPSCGPRYINGHLFLVSLNHRHRYNSLPIHITAYLSTPLLFFVPSGHKLPIYKDALQQYGQNISPKGCTHSHTATADVSA